MHPLKASSGILQSSVVTALLMASTSGNGVPLITPLNLGNRKKPQGGQVWRIRGLLQSWPLWFFSYSPSSRGWSRGPDFLMWRPSKGPWRWSSRGFQKKPSGGASKRERKGWTSVWDWRETILKGTSCNFNLFFVIKFLWSVPLLFRRTSYINKEWPTSPSNY